MTKMKLFGEPGWGSAIVETQLDWYGLEYELERVGDLFKSEEARRRLEAVNPLAQIPTLVLEDGSVMTESAAITLYLAERTGNDTLVPSPGDVNRPAFLRWLVFLVANVYPTYTYADDPSRFVESGAEAQQRFRAAVGGYAERLYRLLEGEARAPWFLGERLSALDIYIAVMSRWRPGRPWFAANAPKLIAIAKGAEALPRLAAAWARNAA
ncbi:MAG TPA: glutathione S-transferase [Gammaproteobacteria bacterium]|nr:glutathione S-transferase [Gammaproteobacteria bacterium]